MATAAFVAFGRDQQVLAESSQLMPTDRTSVGRRLAIGRWSNRPPARRGQLRHLAIVAPVGLGIGVGIALALGNRRRHTAKQQRADRKLGLHRDEPPALELQRTAIAQLDSAIETLTGASEQALEEAVHDTRKAIKRVRTLLRLLRTELPRGARRRADEALREAGHSLSPTRDADVALATLEALVKASPKRLRKSNGVKRLRKRLAAERATAQQDLHTAGSRGRAIGLLQSARAELGATAALLRGEDAEPDRRQFGDYGLVNPGLGRIYRRGRKAMKRARKRGDAPSMHEWRKRAKDFRYASEALTSKGAGAATKRMRKLARSADELGEMLGQERDLALLAERVRKEQRVFKGDRKGRRALLKAIAKRRKRLRRIAFKRGEALYGRKPKRFLRRVRKSLR
ncbi:MAG TPA: CHAD domain-containing protein [Solirubrobacteraceae bacterium]|jgi:CHAD domain-containing protein